MRCREARRSFGARLDRRLAPAGRDALDAHLTACAGCRAELARWEATAGALRALGPTAVPAGLAERAFRAAVEAAPRSPPSPFAWFVPVAGRMAVAGAIAASAVWIAVLATDPSPRAAGAAAAQDPLEVAVLLWSAGSPDGD
jgi:anti-sigma factor RsiW